MKKHQCHDTDPSAAKAGLTLTTLAKATRLPIEFLRSLGVADAVRNGTSAVKIPYMDQHGETKAIRSRLSLNGAQRYAWRKEDKPLLYGLWRLRDIRQAGWVLLLENELDCWTAWHHNLPALGIPGKGAWNPAWAEHITGLEVFLWQEPESSASLAKLVDDIPGLKAIKPPEGVKDLSEMHLKGKDVPELIETLKGGATPVSMFLQAALEAEIEELRLQAAPLFEYSNVLEGVIEAMRTLGLAGQEREAKILYLALTSRVMAQPVNVVVKGASSGGKSHLVAVALRLFPASAYYDVTAMSEKVLLHFKEPMSHRFLIIYEATGLGSDFAQYIIRSLLSEGRVKYDYVGKDESEKFGPIHLEWAGPTGLITTTTAISLHPENETRMLSLEVNDTPEQTRAVLLAQAERDCRPQPDLSAFLAFQQLLDLDPREVEVPFGVALAQECNPSAVRIRRDFPMVLTLVKTHALLHAHHREKGEGGQVIATLEDYDAVYHLVADLLAYGTGQRVTADVRKAREAVGELTNWSPDHDGVSLREVAESVGISESTASRWVKKALRLGFLLNQETRRGRPYRLAVGAPLPEESEVLPHPDLLKEKGGGYTPRK